MIEMIGRRFGRLIVLNREPNRGRNLRKIYWKCKCDCGGFNICEASALRRGDITSCGCYRLERVRAAKRTHGHTWPDVSPEYRAWTHAKGRCENPKDKKYVHYGARGIRMCEKWRMSFQAFYAHVGPKPKGKTLGRIDNDKDYEPGNVRWETHSQQNRNRRPFLRGKRKVHS